MVSPLVRASPITSNLASDLRTLPVMGSVSVLYMVGVLCDRAFKYCKLKPKTAIGSICDGDYAAVELDSVFYNGKPETCTTLLA